MRYQSPTISGGVDHSTTISCGFHPTACPGSPYRSPYPRSVAAARFRSSPLQRARTNAPASATVTLKVTLGMSRIGVAERERNRQSGGCKPLGVSGRLQEQESLRRCRAERWLSAIGCALAYAVPNRPRSGRHRWRDGAAMRRVRSSGRPLLRRMTRPGGETQRTAFGL